MTNEEQQPNQASHKTEIVANIPVQQPVMTPVQKIQPQPAAQKNQGRLSNENKTNVSIKKNDPRDHNLVVILVACLVAIGLSIAATVAFKSSI